MFRTIISALFEASVCQKFDDYDGDDGHKESHKPICIVMHVFNVVSDEKRVFHNN